MLNEKLLTEMEAQLNLELHSSYLYYSMSNWAKTQNWNGFSVWLEKQATEEMLHATNFNRLIVSYGVTPKYSSVSGVKNQWTDLENLFQEALAHERAVSSQIRKLTETAKEAKNDIISKFLITFQEEQLEEENTTEEIYVALTRIGKNQGLIYALDGRVGQRVQ